MSNTSFCTSCFKSLGVPSRMGIYGFLQENKEASVMEIVEVVGLTQPTVSYHLTEMKKNGILNSRKKGKEVYYSLANMCPYTEHSCVLAGVDLPGGSTNA